MDNLNLNELNNLTHNYRKELERIEKRTGAPAQFVTQKGSGSEIEMIERMDADMTKIERSVQDIAQNRAQESRLAAIEARLGEPVYTSRAAAVSRGSDTDPKSAAYAERWIKATARGDLAELRVMSNGTSNAGVPTDLERRIVAKLQQASALRSLAKITTIDSARTVTIENALPTSALVADNGSVSAADATFSAQISVVPYKFVCATTMTQEFIDDVVGTAGIGTGLDYIAQRCAASLALTLDQFYTVGTGTSQPQGIFDTGATALAGLVTQGVVLAEDALITAVTGDNIIDCVHAVPPQYRQSPRFKWLFSDTFLKTVRKIKVTGQNDYVWKPSENYSDLTAGVPGFLYGVPYVIGKYVADADTTSTTTAIQGKAMAGVGHWDYFEIFDRTGMTSMIDPYSGAANMRSTLYTYMRTDSRIMQPEAFASIRFLNAA
jgi:HK97 family phage major capsid protein